MDHTIKTASQLGQALKSCRKERGLTQEALGTKVGLLQTDVSSMERDPGRSSSERLLRLLSALDMEIVLRDKRQARTLHSEW